MSQIPQGSATNPLMSKHILAGWLVVIELPFDVRVTLPTSWLKLPVTGAIFFGNEGQELPTQWPY
jgi:hypothetical protein